MNLSVVLPCFNEAENIEQTVADVQRWFTDARIDGTIIAVDDGSADRTLIILEAIAKIYSNVRVVHHEKNQGYGAAIRSGCDAAVTDLIAFMDSDGQFKAEEIGLLLPLMKTYACVTGIRMRRADPLHRKLNSWLYGQLARFVLGIRVTDLNCGLKLFTRAVWQQVRPVHATGALFNAEVFLHLRDKNIPFGEVPIPHYPRKRGNPTGANLKVILRMFKELIELRRDHAASVAQANVI